MDRSCDPLIFNRHDDESHDDAIREMYTGNIQDSLSSGP
jgi:hypothetical protein